MNSPRELRRRIRSVGSTAQITRAMEMVAASKMRKAQEGALAGRPFVARFYRIQREVTRRIVDFTHPLLEQREVRRRGIILVAADKGLCGPLNSTFSGLPPSLILRPQFSLLQDARPRSLSPAPVANLSQSLNILKPRVISRQRRLLPAPATSS